MVRGRSLKRVFFLQICLLSVDNELNVSGTKATKTRLVSHLPLTNQFKRILQKSKGNC